MTKKPAEKQEWVYTEGGAKLKKAPRKVNLKINKWYFIAPWILWLILIVYLFVLGDSWTVLGFLLIIFGPVPITILNIRTFKKLIESKLKAEPK